MKLIKRFKVKWIKPLKFLIPFIIFLICIIIASVSIRTGNILTGHDSEEVHFFIYLATLALGLIAYYEFDRSNKLIANEFLLFISNRWNSKQIIKARQILHDIFIDIYRDEQGNKKCEYNEALFYVSKNILQMSRAKNKDKGKDFISLLNLLDYLETLSYFCNRGDLKLEDIQNTCGNNALFFFESFKLYIEKRQTHDTSHFKNFTNLYYQLKERSLNV